MRNLYTEPYNIEEDTLENQVERYKEYVKDLEDANKRLSAKVELLYDLVSGVLKGKRNEP